jgi:hypothetical protein
MSTTSEGATVNSEVAGGWIIVCLLGLADW